MKEGYTVRSMAHVSELETQFGIAGALQFEEDPGGLIRAAISTPLCEAEIWLQGAHISRWTPEGDDPVLFMSSASAFAPGKAIRGGVPVIFPWFGGRSDGKPGPAHGFARSMVWDVESTRLLPGGEVEISLTLTPNDATRALGFDAFHARFRATFGATLGMDLEVRNDSPAPFTYEEALHSYFAISEISQACVTGLEDTTFIDKTDGFQRKVQPDEPVFCAKETDQVHLNTTATCIIHDDVWDRRISVEKSGSQSTIVWNPWADKAAGMADMGVGEWEAMICVETGNAADNAITLAPGESHTLTATISLQP